MRSDRVVVLPPLLDDDLSFFQTVEDLSIEQLIAQLCCDIPASRQAIAVGLPCAIDTSIWRSSVTICSALNLFFGMTGSFPSSFSHNAWFKKARSGQTDRDGFDSEQAILWQNRNTCYDNAGKPLRISWMPVAVSSELVQLRR